MSVERLLEREVTTALLEAAPSHEPERLYESIVSATGRVRPRPRWLAIIKEPPMRYRSHLASGSPTLRLASVLALTLALVLALGVAVVAGASLVPSPGPVPPVAPTWVTGHIQHAPDCSNPPPVVDGDVSHYRDLECQPRTWTSSDPRLAGEAAARWNTDVYQTDTGAISVEMEAEYLRNDGGGWACWDTNLYQGSSQYATTVLKGATYICVGDGGYAGLSAVLVHKDAGGNDQDIVGLIFSGDLPPLPGAPVLESPAAKSPA